MGTNLACRARDRGTGYGRPPKLRQSSQQHRLARTTLSDRRTILSCDTHRRQTLHSHTGRCRKGVRRRLHGCCVEPYPLGWGCRRAWGLIHHLCRGTSPSPRCIQRKGLAPLVCPSMLRAYRYACRRHSTEVEEQRMLYGDRAYCIAYAHSRTRKALRRASKSRGRDEHANEEDSDFPERLGTSNAGRAMPALRPPRRVRRTT
jgi:hypothetical protein